MGYRTDIVNLSLSFEVTIIIFQIPIKGPFDDCKRQAKAKIFSICTKLFILCYTYLSTHYYHICTYLPITEVSTY